MKTILKNEAICLIILTISVLLFTDCNHKMVQNARDTDFISTKPPNYFDIFDTIMLAKVHKVAVDSLKNLNVLNPIFKDTLIEEQYIAEFCKCYVESNNILELTLKSKSNMIDCIRSPVGYQRFRLTLYKFVTTTDTAISFYTFAAMEKNTTWEERMQNFYISEVIGSQNVSHSIHFTKRYNYDLVFRKEKMNPVKYDFFMEKMSPNDDLCFTKIISRDFNMIGGNKSLVFYIKKSFDANGILLIRQKNPNVRVVQK